MNGVMMAVGTEGLERIVEADLAAVMAPEMQHRIPSARHGDEIAVDLLLLDHPALALAIGRHLDAGDVEAAKAGVHRRDDGAGIHLDAGLARLGRQRALGAAPRVEDPHQDAGRLQNQRGLVGIVVVGEDHAR
jgi:hypothetical protein